MTQKNARRSESGNVIFYIMAGIALLAALSMAVSQGSRSTATSLTDDRTRLFATEIIASGDAMTKAVATLRLRGIPVTSLDFETPQLPGYDTPACNDSSCHIFDLAGGGISFSPVPNDWLQQSMLGNMLFGEPLYSGHYCVPGVGLSGTAHVCDGATELIMLVPYLKREICTKINDLLSIPNDGADAPEISACPTDSRFNGSLSDVGGIAIDGPGGDRFFARAGGCFKASTSCTASPGAYIFYQVLSAR